MSKLIFRPTKKQRKAAVLFNSIADRERVYAYTRAEYTAMIRQIESQGYRWINSEWLKQ
jgi:hypothetical protein